MPPALLLGLLAAGAGAGEGSAPTRWALDAGAGWRLWSPSETTAERREYLDRARGGTAAGLEAAVFFRERWGAGLLHAQFRSSAAESAYAFPDGSTGRSEDEYLILYAAPALYARTAASGGRWSLVAHAGPGLFFYRNRSRAGEFPGVLEGNAPGLHAAVSADVRITRRFAAGAGVRLVHGNLGNLEYNAQPVSTAEISLTRVDVTAGIRFYP